MKRLRAALVGSVLFASYDAGAQESSVATARQLAIAGIDAVESGDCAKGAPLLDRAEHLHHAAVHLQYLARCSAASSKLVAATEMWRRIIREGAPQGSSPAVATALAEAQSELEKTLPRLASATIRTAQQYPELSLSIDGTKMPADMVGAPQIIDPGEHDLTVSAPGFEISTRHFNVDEGGTAELRVELLPLPGGATAEGSHPEPAKEGARKSSSPLRLAGWITGSVGAASLIAGTVTLLARNARRSDLAAKCGPTGACPDTKFTASSLEDEKQSVRDFTAASNVLLWGGGALVAGGVTLIVIASQGDTAKGPTTALLAGAPRAAAGMTVRGHW